ncbi:MAG TPA: hypothetical protein VGM37_12135 [Armatimonadota bacterium]|jgi:hypothetical protein
MRKPDMLCIVPDDGWVETDWAAFGLPGAGRRKVAACLTNIYEYGDHGIRGISDWARAKEDCGVHAGIELSFGDLTAILARLTAGAAGVYACMGHLDARQAEPGASAGSSRQLKLCRVDPGPGYALGLSCAETLSKLRGFAPDGVPEPFHLDWFPPGDPAGEHIRNRWNEWPGVTEEWLIPGSPSPSQDSVEIVNISWEGDFLGVFTPHDPSVAELREWLGPEAILAGMQQNAFTRYVEGFGFNTGDLTPVDRDFPPGF